MNSGSRRPDFFRKRSWRIAKIRRDREWRGEFGVGKHGAVVTGETNFPRRIPDLPDWVRETMCKRQTQWFEPGLRESIRTTVGGRE